LSTSSLCHIQRAGFMRPRRRFGKAAVGSCWGAGPRKTTRLVATHSPVRFPFWPRARGQQHVTSNLPTTTFTEPATLGRRGRKTFLARGRLWRWVAARAGCGQHVSQTIDGNVEAINAGLQSLKEGRGVVMGSGGDRGSQTWRRRSDQRSRCRGRHPFLNLLFRPSKTSLNFDEACMDSCFSCCSGALGSQPHRHSLKPVRIISASRTVATATRLRRQIKKRVIEQGARLIGRRSA